MAESVNDIITKLANIEHTAVRIIESANDEKESIRQEYEKKTKEFDDRLAAEIDTKLTEIKKVLDEEEQKEIEHLKKDTDRSLEKLESMYGKRMHDWVDRVFHSIVEV